MVLDEIVKTVDELSGDINEAAVSLTFRSYFV
jgi:hypothetical protein